MTVYNKSSSKEQNMKKQHFTIFSIIVFFIAMVLLTIIALPLIRTVISGDSQDFKNFIDGFGASGYIIMMIIQIAQIIVALIPGEVVEFVAGTLYGWFGGLLFCLIGITVGQTLIFISVRFFGRNFVEKVAGNENLKRFRFLNDEKKLKTALFILYFIPGTPKDLLTYIFPLTKINLKDFLIITLFARIPSIVTSTYGGDAFANKDYKTLLIVYIVIMIISIGGAMLYRKWEYNRDLKSKKNEQDG